MYRIMGRYKGKCQNEELDTASTKEMAQHYRAEYALAFGRDWVIWIEEG